MTAIINFDLMSTIVDYLESDNLIIEITKHPGMLVTIDVTAHNHLKKIKKVCIAAFMVKNPELRKAPRNFHKEDLRTIRPKSVQLFSGAQRTKTFFFSTVFNGKYYRLDGVDIHIENNQVQRIKYYHTNDQSLVVESERYGYLTDNDMFKLHREGNYAKRYFYIDGRLKEEHYYSNGNTHNDSGPAIICFELGEKTEHYFLNGNSIGKNLGLYSKEDIQNFLLL